MSENLNSNYVYKLALLGDEGVGKTSIINQHVEHKFENDYKPTLGVNIVHKESRLIPTERGETLANKINASDFIETSAKSGEYLENAFKKLVHGVLTFYGKKNYNFQLREFIRS